MKISVCVFQFNNNENVLLIFLFSAWYCYCCFAYLIPNVHSFVVSCVNKSYAIFLIKLFLSFLIFPTQMKMNELPKHESSLPTNESSRILNHWLKISILRIDISSALSLSFLFFARDPCQVSSLSASHPTFRRSYRGCLLYFSLYNSISPRFSVSLLAPPPSVALAQFINVFRSDM